MKVEIKIDSADDLESLSIMFNYKNKEVQTVVKDIKPNVNSNETMSHGGVNVEEMLNIANS